MLPMLKNFKEFRRYAGKRIYLIIFVIFLVGLLEGIGMTLFLPILQSGFGDDRLSQILKYAFGVFHMNFSFTAFLALILLFFILRAGFLIWHAWYFGKVYAAMTIGLIRTTFDHIFEADYLFLLKKEAGFINNILMREIVLVVESFYTFSLTLRSIVFAMMYIILASLLNFKITAVLMALSPFVIYTMRRVNAMTSDTSKKLTASYGNFHSIAAQILSKLKYLKATMSYPSITRIIDKENKVLGFQRIKLFFLHSLAVNMADPMMVVVAVALLYYYVIIMKRDVKEIMFLVFLFLNVAKHFSAAQVNYRKYLAAVGSIEAYNKFEKELLEHKEDLHLPGAPPDFTKEITFRNVTVVFPNGRKALDSVNMTIRPNATVAVVGHSGSGKSTIANMVTGLVRPTSGGVYFGGVNYNNLNLKTLRAKIGYVTQEDIIFHAKIRDNISLWEERPDEEMLRKAMELAHISHFVKTLRNHDQEVLTGDGLDLSGGQRQRIAIARELYKKAEILLLDEATSALDAEAEKSIYESLKGFKNNKTMLIIAHRLSTMKNADYIYVMDEGRIVEEGTFDELYTDKTTKFHKICMIQNV